MKTTPADPLPRAYHIGRMARRSLPYGIRLFIAVYLIVQLAPNGPRITPEAPQTVQTNHPLICVHTRLTDEVESWKIQRTLQLVREMGAPTIVEFIPWAYIEGAEGRYDWSHPDRILSLAEQQGLTVIARIGLVPDWARSKDPNQRTSLNSLVPEHYADYARFVGAFAARYRGRIRHIIAWNEPNLSFEWGYRSVSPAEYVTFLKGVYAEAHRANPDVILIGGALAPTLEPAGSTNAINDLDFLQGVYDVGGAAYFDALSIHSYGLTSPPEEAPDPGKLNFRRAELIRAIMVRNGDSAKPVYITESGWNDHPRWAFAVRPGERVTYTLDAFRRVEQQWPWAKTLCIWNFRIPAPTRSYPDYWTFVTPDFQKRAIYDAVKAYATS